MRSKISTSLHNIISALNHLKSEIRTDTKEGLSFIDSINELISYISKNKKTDLKAFANAFESHDDLSEQLKITIKEIQLREKNALHTYYKLIHSINKECISEVFIKDKKSAEYIIKEIVRNTCLSDITSSDFQLVPQTASYTDYCKIEFHEDTL